MEYVHKCSMAIYGCKETKPNQREILAAMSWLILKFNCFVYFFQPTKTIAHYHFITFLHFVFQGGGKKQRKHQQSGCALISPPSDRGG